MDECEAPKNFSVGHLNIRSMNTGFHEFTSYVERYKFEILALSETWLSQDQPSHAFQIPGYNFIRKDRQARGGGIAMYIKKGLAFNKISLEFDSENLFEFMCIEFVFFSKKYFLISIYRVPSTNIPQFNQKLEDLLTIITPLYENIIITGDLNINLLHNSVYTISLKNILNNFSLNQLIDRPTRIDSHSATLIDLMITSSNLEVIDSNSVEISEQITDHNLIYVSINLPKLQVRPRLVYFRNYNNIDFNIFNQDALNIQWEQTYRIPNIEEKVKLLNTNIHRLINKHAPLQVKQIKEGQYTPWITQNIRLLMKLRDKARRTYNKDKTEPKLQYYRELRNYTKHAILREKAAFFNQLSLKRGREFWQAAGKLRMTSKDANQELPPQFNNPAEINKHFLSNTQTEVTTSEETVNFYLSNKKENVAENFHFTLIDPETVEKLLNQINTNAIGEDGISRRDLQICLPYIIGPLTNIINTCLLEGVFPDIWKKSVVKPIPKTAKPLTVNDLRPISILPTMSKVIEKFIFHQISSFSENFKIIPSCQSGFRKQFSTSSCLVRVLNDIRHNEEVRSSTCLTMLDFSKAFDTLDHKMMLAKLHYYNFSQYVINFFSNFLHNRACCVSIATESGVKRSEYEPITKGVPQGSILSPLLFSIYVADMHSCLLYSSLQQYADDSQVYIPINQKDLADCNFKINLDLNRIFSYANNHNLKINAAKSQSILINQNKQVREHLQNNMSVTLNNEIIPFKSEAKNLGIIIDEATKFESHINHKLKTAYYRLKNIYYLKNCLPSKTKYFLCDTLILSLFDYGDVVYSDSITSLYKRKIQKLQNTCMRFSFNIPYRHHITPYLNDNKILTMENRRECHMLCFIFKIIKTGKPEYLHICLVPLLHTYETRNVNLYRIPFHHTANFKKSFAYTASKIWNNLPNNIKYFSFYSFKGHVKSMLLRAQL